MKHEMRHVFQVLWQRPAAVQGMHLLQHEPHPASCGRSFRELAAMPGPKQKAITEGGLLPLLLLLLLLLLLVKPLER